MCTHLHVPKTHALSSSKPLQHLNSPRATQAIYSLPKFTIGLLLIVTGIGTFPLTGAAMLAGVAISIAGCALVERSGQVPRNREVS